jgi:hypothetical protein
VFAQKSQKQDSKHNASPSVASSKSTNSSSSSASGSKVKTIICRTCGQQGHVSNVCPNKKPPPKQIHAMAATPDDASESSDEESVLILTQYTEDVPVPPDNAAVFAQDTSSTLPQIFYS